MGNWWEMRESATSKERDIACSWADEVGFSMTVRRRGASVSVGRSLDRGGRAPPQAPSRWAFGGSEEAGATTTVAS